MDNIESLTLDPMPTEKMKSLKEIITEGYNWQCGLSTVIADLCGRVKELEEVTKNINKKLN